MDPGGWQQLIDDYRDGPPRVREARAGIQLSELDVRPSSEAWTVREIVHHLADAELMAASRIRRLIAQDRPTIPSYDENQFARRLHYERPIESSLDLLATSRRSTADLLDRLTDTEWLREGNHDEYEGYSVEYIIRRAAAHCPMHADQIKRARAGKS